MKNALTLADHLRRQLLDVDPTVLNRWILYAKARCFQHALFLAKTLQVSVSLSPDQRQSYRLINEVMSKNKKRLKSLSRAELNKLLDEIQKSLDK